MLVLRTFLFTMFVPGSVAIGIPYLLSAFFPARIDIGWIGYTGIGFLIVGGVLYLAGVIGFVVTGRGTPAVWFTRRWRLIIGEEPVRLVANGIYKRTRNPLYLGVVSVVLGQAIFTGVIALFFYALVLWPLFHAVVVLLEEPHLRDKFGENYNRYIKSTPRWLG